uniref:Putative ovule protein n=1 Tax=Solanum chacoense TaxID=4108 RepID=A0A0V0H8G0_SOLCH
MIVIQGLLPWLPYHRSSVHQTGDIYPFETVITGHGTSDKTKVGTQVLSYVASSSQIQCALPP